MSRARNSYVLAMHCWAKSLQSCKQACVHLYQCLKCPAHGLDPEACDESQECKASFRHLTMSKSCQIVVRQEGAVVSHARVLQFRQASCHLAPLSAAAVVSQRRCHSAQTPSECMHLQVNRHTDQQLRTSMAASANNSQLEVDQLTASWAKVHMSCSVCSMLVVTKPV